MVGFEDAIIKSDNKNFITVENGVEIADSMKYQDSLIGRVNYVLQIEPDNAWFRTKAKELAEKAVLD